MVGEGEWGKSKKVGVVMERVGCGLTQGSSPPFLFERRDLGYGSGSCPGMNWS